ncbi:HU family DNA-binding protein [Devosia sp. WQ 349]|uniref:HU family DNA-binding protein n=1 Tax=Devosia sp. WQ 349K1 TaxID=2800329 RepID=UPI001907869A|nr:HU family DNA-binding protein [Devosia sp. WQ 349K1]
MPLKTVTREQLTEVAYAASYVDRDEAKSIVSRAIEMIGNAIIDDQLVKLTSFGTFEVRSRLARLGRNPRTLETATIAPRRVVVFRPSAALQNKIKIAQSK